jgi:hypothetical protein
LRARVGMAVAVAMGVMMVSMRQRRRWERVRRRHCDGASGSSGKRRLEDWTRERRVRGWGDDSQGRSTEAASRGTGAVPGGSVARSSAPRTRAEIEQKRAGSRLKQSRLVGRCLAARIGLLSLSEAGWAVMASGREMKDGTGRTWEATSSEAGQATGGHCGGGGDGGSGEGRAR